MTKKFNLGKMAGLNVIILPAFFIGTILLWAVLSGIGVLIFNLPFYQALIVGLMATLLYWVTGVIHYLGHAFASHRTGYPMVGFQLGKFFVLGSTLYPEDEEQLPAKIHIRRALGGPIGSLVASIVIGIVALNLRPIGDVIWWIAVFVFLTNFLVNTIGPFIPLGFTDGSTILEWRKKR